MENERLAQLVKEAKGERSIRDYARDSGVNPTTISMIISKGYTPSSSVIRKLGSPKAGPQGNVTLQDLMIAAGYSEDYIKPDIMIDDGEQQYIVQATTSGRMTDKHRIFSQYLQLLYRYKSIAAGVIYTALAKKGIVFTAGKDPELINVRGFKPDVFVKLQDGSLSEWWFDLRKLKSEQDALRYPSIYYTRNIMSSLFFIEPDKNRKISIVLDNEWLFNAFVSVKGMTSYRGDLSIILIDTEKLCVKKEEYIAFYNLDDNEDNKPKLI